MDKTVNLPAEIDLVKYVASRKNEIDLLKSESFLSKENNQKSLFQLLPRHMRRRTMGYLRKRLPRRIRAHATIKPPNKISKRPSRKYRRKRSNLLSEYERRKHATAKKMWLETHIWHAKRFHMSESLYEYRLPVNFHCKCKRAVFKCLKESCCIHDESYYVCHQLNGPQSELINNLNKLCSQETGLTFGAKMYLDGKFEGNLTLFNKNKYPHGCIGPVRFLWKPQSHPQNVENRYLWIWSHSSIHKQVEEQLINVFSLYPSEISEEMAYFPSNDKKNDKDKNVEMLDNSIKSDIIFDNLENYNEKKIRLISLKDKLNRFKLIGPMSTSILANVLSTNSKNKNADLWNKINKAISSPNEITSSTVIGLSVKDPRLSLPKKKSFNKTLGQNHDINCISQNESDNYDLKNILRSQYLSESNIWNRHFISELNKSKIKTSDINKIRSKFLIPGTTTIIENKQTDTQTDIQIPILLIQSSLNNKMFSIQKGSLFTGWDIIIPNKWAMDFWLPMIHMGARAIGQYELNYLLFESGNLKFPNEWLDTNSGRMENESLKEQQFKKYLAKPPSKRVNYLKNGYMSPFIGPWSGLYKLHKSLNNEEVKEFFVLKNRRLISKLESAFFNKSKNIKIINFDEKEMELINHSYIGIRLTSFGKGDISQYSIIFVENSFETTNKKEKTIVNISINKLINDSKDLHFKSSTKKTETSKINIESPKPTLNKLIRSKFNKHKLLTDEKTFLQHELNINMSKNEEISSRKVPIGCVQTGGFALVNGKCSGNAFVLTKSILDLLQMKMELKNKHIVSYKAPDSNCFRQAKIDHFFI